MATGRQSAWRRWTSAAAITSTLLSGCVRDRNDVKYVGKEKRELYRAHAMDVAFPTVNEPLPPEVTSTAPPHTILETDEIPIRDISLAETMQLSLQNSQVIRTAGTFLMANTLLTNPQNTPSEYDPAIQASGVLFGARGVEAALSAFDAQLNSSMVWGRNETITNSVFGGVGLPSLSTLSQETGVFTSSLQKTMANGGVVSLNHNVNYLGSNSPGLAYPSAYSGLVGANYSLPLLAGSGTEFTRVAGPISQSFNGVSGVNQGVLIARINEDISIATFELALRNLVKDVENAYWDLYLAYRNYHTAVTARESSLLTWRIADLQLQGGVRTRAEVAQARDQYFATEAASMNARSNIYTAEVRLRRLMGLSANDGTTLRPLDEPVTAQLVPDWYISLTEALTQRVELRTQKWNLKSLELQLDAANSLVRPQLNFVSGYQVNGFGDQLLGYNGQTTTSNFYQNVTAGNQTGWNLGLQFNWAIGFRAALAQVRNYELRVAKAQRVLAEQEKEVAMELAATFQELSRAFAAAELNMNRMIAARENVKFLEPNIREGTILLDELLRAQLRQAEAEVAYYQSLVQYNQSLNDLQYRKGTILPHNAIYLAEGSWAAEAYEEADHNADARNHAIDASGVKETVPQPFASPMPVDNIYFSVPNAEPTPADDAAASVIMPGTTAEPTTVTAPAAKPLPAKHDELP
ncbi:TolC family protein [Planctomicrobium piriforme]|uniref:Outer membrane protein TolC n=1 Tax=Planctomicrobium piriforme TaxID=1576369 RepID=A0A1I3IIK1_9PLAN|nr:TolC family protein [Planctomicrobium piriforme]SFI47808.1 Outer membrane protein TolC [Planctomicrobium piriforme]